MKHEHDHMDHGHHMDHGTHNIDHASHEDHEHHYHLHHSHHEMMMEDFKRRFIVSTILTIPVLILSPTVSRIFGFDLEFPGKDYVLFIFSLVIYTYGGKPFLKGTIDELKKRSPGMMTLIGLAISVAFFYSSAVTFGVKGKTFYWELATLIDIMLMGHYIEMRSVLGASRALEEIVKLIPSEAHLVEDGKITDIEVKKLKKGDVVLVKPGEKFPSDGVIIEGETSVDESILTGESKPVHKKVGDEVIGGSMNIEGAVKVRIERTGKETYIMNVIDLVEKAQATRSRIQDLADRMAFYLTLISIGTGTFTLGTWLILGKSFVFALERMVTVMVITCPHALGLAIPLVVAVSTSISAKKGILIRNREAFERMKDIDAVVFDKTGTLTKGNFVVTDVVTLNDMDEEEMISYASAVEMGSNHPIALGIVRKAQDMGLDVPQATDVKILPGRGVTGYVDGKKISILSPSQIDGSIPEDERLKRLSEQGKTIVFLLVDDVVKGAIALSDEIREESFEAVERLKKLGKKVYMLTGDDERVARWVAYKLKLDGFFARVLPHEKASRIEELKSRGLKVAMIGDGVNDAPALVTANVGMAIGAGTDVAIESADVILVRNDPRDVVEALELSRITYKKMLQNLAWATGYNVVAIPLAAGVLYPFGVLLSPAVGAILMSLSTVIVAINARTFKISG